MKSIKLLIIMIDFMRLIDFIRSPAVILLAEDRGIMGSIPGD